VGRFTKLGMPMPEVLAPAIAVLEIGGGLLLMSGLGTRLISVPFIIIGCWASSETTARTARADLMGSARAKSDPTRERGYLAGDPDDRPAVLHPACLE
jgi:hypothetical protein